MSLNQLHYRLIAASHSKSTASSFLSAKPVNVNSDSIWVQIPHHANASMIGKGLCGASCDAESIDDRMQMWFSKASSTIMSNIVLDGLNYLDDLEIFVLEARGVLPDMSNFTIDIQVKQADDIPLEKGVEHNTKEEFIDGEEKDQEVSQEMGQEESQEVTAAKDNDSSDGAVLVNGHEADKE